MEIYTVFLPPRHLIIHNCTIEFRWSPALFLIPATLKDSQSLRKAVIAYILKTTHSLRKHLGLHTNYVFSAVHRKPK